jgi:hypothetical protein
MLGLRDHSLFCRKHDLWHGGSLPCAELGLAGCLGPAVLPRALQVHDHVELHPGAVNSGVTPTDHLIGEESS